MRAGPILKELLKWIVIPIALVGIGFYFIGPKIGQSDVAQNIAAPAQNNDQSSDDKPKITRHGEPKVEIVSVERGGNFRPVSNDYSSERTRSERMSLSGDQPRPKKKHKKRHRDSSQPPPDIPFDLGPPPGDTVGPPTDGGGPGGPG